MQSVSDDSQDPHTESHHASRDTPPLLAINVPGQGPVVGTYAQYTIVRPLIILEVENGICYMSTQFELEVEVLGNSNRSVLLIFELLAQLTSLQTIEPSTLFQACQASLSSSR